MCIFKVGHTYVIHYFLAVIGHMGEVIDVVQTRVTRWAEG